MPPVDFKSDIHERLAAAEAALHAVGQQISPAIRHVDIAVLIPCYNEAGTIGDVVKSFRIALPHARIFVYDNNSHDNTTTVAREAGAIVRREPLQGKGHVVRRMFSDIEADVYVMVDGDATYDAASAPRLVSRLLETQADMVVGARITEDKAAYRAGHRFGNKLLTGLVSGIFGDRFTDMLSGYRAFSRRFVKSFPALASGFETETELTVHALELDMITAEVQTPYGARRIGSVSKLSTIRDGFRILGTIGRLMRDERPLLFFGAIAATIMLAALAFGAPVIAEYMSTGLVPRFPTAFLCGTLAVLSCISLVSGIILETVSLGRREMKRLAYNEIESLAAKLERLEETRLTLTSLRAQVLHENPIAARAIPLPKRRTH
jgi:hypothetical protein